MPAVTDNPSNPFVSVIVPVYNDVQRIGVCIEALLTQTYSHEKYEVLIVDNGSTDGTCDVIKKYPVTLLIEDRIQSSYSARNKGIKYARGEVIAFTDSDCIPDPDWIEKGVINLLKVPDCGLIAGRINLFCKNPDKPTAVELYEIITQFKQEKSIEFERYGATANLFTFKSVFNNVGLFNDKLKSGGDNEWGRRVFSSGYKQIYSDDTCVAHPARYSFSHLRKRTIRLIGGCYQQYWGNSFESYIFELKKSIKKILAIIARITLGIYKAERLNGTKKKFQYIFVTIFIEMVGTWERTRLLLGGRLKR